MKSKLKKSSLNSAWDLVGRALAVGYGSNPLAVVPAGPPKLSRRAVRKPTNNRKRLRAASKGADNKRSVPAKLARRIRPVGARGVVPKTYHPSGPIKTVKGGKKVTRVDGYKVMLKLERGQQFVAFNCIYPGGCTHPSEPTLQMVCLALIRFMAKKAAFDFGDFNDSNALPFAPLSKWSVFYYWKGEGQTANDSATFRENVSANANTTWLSLSQALATSFVTTFGTSARRLLAIGIYPDQDAAPSHSFISTQYYNASDLFISVKGESSVQVQNRTLGDGTTGDQADASNIFNNPLRGKYYTFKAGRPLIRNVGQSTASQKVLMDYQTTSGTISTQDRFDNTATGSNYDANVALSLRKPVNGPFFTNCLTTKYVQVEPGAVVKSKLDHSISKSLMNWIRAFQEKFTAVTPKTLVGMANDDPYDYRLGKSHLFGLEKMVDTSVVSAPEITVGLEHNLFMVARCTYRPKNTAVSLINILTT